MEENSKYVKRMLETVTQYLHAVLQKIPQFSLENPIISDKWFMIVRLGKITIITRTW